MEILSSITFSFLFVSTLVKSPSCLVPGSFRACMAGRAAPGGAADRGLALARRSLPAALPGAGTAACRACRDAQDGMQGCRVSQLCRRARSPGWAEGTSGITA